MLGSIVDQPGQRTKQRTHSLLDAALLSALPPGSLRAFFRGNGTNVIKITPETAIKLSANDYIKRLLVADLDDITPVQRLISGALAGATAQARPRWHRYPQAVMLCGLGALRPLPVVATPVAYPRAYPMPEQQLKERAADIPSWPGRRCSFHLSASHSTVV